MYFNPVSQKNSNAKMVVASTKFGNAVNKNFGYSILLFESLVMRQLFYIDQTAKTIAMTTAMNIHVTQQACLPYQLRALQKNLLANFPDNVYPILGFVITIVTAGKWTDSIIYFMKAIFMQINFNKSTQSKICVSIATCNSGFRKFPFIKK